MSLIAPLKEKIQGRRPDSIGSMSFPETITHQAETPFDFANQALADLDSQKVNWRNLAYNEKISLLDDSLSNMPALGNAWVDLSLKAKGVHAGGFAEAEEWFIFGSIIRLMMLLRKSLAETMTNGHPTLAGEPISLANGQISVPVFPTSTIEKTLFMGHHAETWLEPTVTQADMFRIPPKDAGRVTLALGAGNISMSPVADMLHFLFVEDDVVLLKMNPVNDYLGPLLEKGFSGLIQRGFLRIVYGGGTLGNYICKHPLVNHIHLTGSDKTFTRLVSSESNDANQRQANEMTPSTMSITAELGCVNPLVLVPGNWKKKDYQRAALMMATWLSSNAGYNCLTPRLIITEKNWAGRQAFLAAFRQLLAETPVRPSYYPGSADSRNKFIDAHPEAEVYTFQGSASEADGTIDALPITFIPNVNMESYNEVCFTSEPFGMLISETAIEADSPSEFLSKATDFVNHHVWGTLSITLMAPAQVESDKQIRSAIQRMIAELNYGTICQNIFPGVAYALANTPWGGYPNQPFDNIQSGTGFINNPVRLNKPQKSVFYAPFQRIDPISIRNRNMVAFCRSYVDLVLKPSLKNTLKVLWLGMKP